MYSKKVKLAWLKANPGIKFQTLRLHPGCYYVFSYSDYHKKVVLRYFNSIEEFTTEQSTLGTFNKVFLINEADYIRENMKSVI